MKLAIIGSRNLCVNLSEFINILPDEIITGGAVGVDYSAYLFAKRNNLSISIIRPNYSKFGKIAPLIRNNKIIDSCDSVLAIWDGYSKGTIHAIRVAKRKNKPVKVIVIKNKFEYKIYDSCSQTRLF